MLTKLLKASLNEIKNTANSQAKYFDPNCWAIERSVYELIDEGYYSMSRIPFFVGSNRNPFRESLSLGLVCRANV